MTKKLLCGVAAALVAFATAVPVWAETYIVPSMQYIDDDDLRAIDDQVGGLQLNYGVTVGDWWDVEFGGFYANWDGWDEADQYGVLLDSHLRFSPDRGQRISPYLLFGTGLMNTHTVRRADDSGWIAAFGAGADWRLSETVSLRTEARVRRDFSPDGENFDDLLFNAGFRISLGGREPVVVDSDGDGVPDDMDRCPGTPAGAVVDARGCELDSDGDGVVDRLDKCPDTRRGARVDANGCEIEERDSDGDGVPDSRDRCPDTVRGAKVDANGCELDSDGDGVVDRLDECPGTPRGQRVNGVGCPLEREVRLEGVFFEFDSAQLQGRAQTRLDQAARTLELNPDIEVEIAGHTDAIGPDSYNQGLSQRRAQSVVDYLVSKGIDRSRMDAKGYGESEPIATNDTNEGRARNRRVMMRILNENITNTARPEPD